jgi:NADPH:quinone reductase-like Zn-dependent oxidoreductase
LYKYQKEHLPLPYIPGFEASGTVIEVGQEITEYNEGDKVVVLQKSGCFSNEIITKKEQLIMIPYETDLALAASLPVNFFTAFHALNNIVKVFPNSKLLIASAAGGVGGLLVQLASDRHRITGLVGDLGKKEYVDKLGADEVYSYEELPDIKSNFDLVFLASGENINEYLSKLSKNGKLLLYGFHAMVPRRKKDVAKSLWNYFTLPDIRLFDLVYGNKTVAGFNIIKFDTESVEFKGCKEAFEGLAASGILPNQHKINIYKPQDLIDGIDIFSQGTMVGKVVIEF